jgi:3-hydroxyacyl-CoA dehydrogenase
MSDVIELSMDGAIGVVTINNPPANALSYAVVKGLDDTIRTCMENDACEAVVLTGAGKMFVAGADIREFNIPRPDDVPELHDMIKGIEDSPKPVVAAVNGLALGGGLELAMGCHYRLIASTAQVGQPEINLGFIPGAGGTQRLPRLAGVENALEMIVGGAPIKAATAVEFGIADELVEGDIVARALEYAANEAKDGGPRPTGTRTEKLSGFDPGIFDKWREKVAPKSRGMDAPFECINTVEAATTMNLLDGLENERVTFVRLRDGNKAKAMRYMFFAEREVAKIPDVPKDTEVLPIQKAAVIGSGTMGGGIAMNFANAGIPVSLVDVSEDALAAGLDKVEQNYAGSVSRGRITQDAMDACMGMISGTTDYADVADADIVIEAVFEDMDLKKKIFAELDSACKPETILASNTSSLDINEIGAATGRPDKVCGAHFFSPANVMKLMENVRTDAASKETVATLMNLSKVLKKTGVLVGVGDGFVGNRMLHVAARIAEFMVEEGALPWQIDKVIYDFGFPMGPFQMNDLAGIDVRYLIREEQKKKTGDRRQSVILDRVYETGRYGQKTGGGWYTYADGDRKGAPEPMIEELILKTSEELGFTRRTYTDEEILERYLYSIINTGAQVLEEGLAIRASDIDVIWHYGYGFPRYQGGPMFYADLVGLDNIYDKVLALHEDYGDWVKPSGLLKSLAEEGKGFADYRAG